MVDTKAKRFKFGQNWSILISKVILVRILGYLDQAEKCIGSGDCMKKVPSWKARISLLSLIFVLIPSVYIPSTASNSDSAKDLSLAPTCLLSLSEYWKQYEKPYPCFESGNSLFITAPQKPKSAGELFMQINNQVIKTSWAMKIDIKEYSLGLNSLRFFTKNINGTEINLTNPIKFIIYEAIQNAKNITAAIEKRTYVVVYEENFDLISYFGSLGIVENEYKVESKPRNNSNLLTSSIVDLSQNQFELLKKNSKVKLVSPEFIVNKSITQVDPPSWGLDRIDQSDNNLDGEYNYRWTGLGVDAYVVDTGINTSHTQFTGRIPRGWKASRFANYIDCDGHGTHVSGTIGGTTYGVAKKVHLVPVRALDCSGSGTWSDVVAGMTWIINDHRSDKPAVVNMSIGGGFDSSINNAVQLLINDGLVVVVAAGNESSNACLFSPSSATNAITVGASTEEDTDAYFSNIGSCVDIFAPGEFITSAYIGSNSASAILDGTSMASPHVAGAAALILEASFSTFTNKLNANAEVRSVLVNNAIEDSLTPCCGGEAWWPNTVNLLLNLSFTFAGPAPQTITFNPPSRLTATSFPYTLIASASSELEPTISSLDTSVCTVEGFTLTMENSGSCRLSVTQDGNENYLPAPTVNKTISLSKTSQSVTFNPPSTLTGSQFPYELTISLNSGLTPSISTSTPSFCSIDGITLNMVSAGKCVIKVDQTGNNLFAPLRPVTRTITLTKSNQVLTFNPPSRLILNQFPYTLEASTTSGLAITFSSRTTRVCTVSGNILNRIASGTCTIVASQPGNGLFNSARAVTKSIRIS